MATEMTPEQMEAQMKEMQKQMAEQYLMKTTEFFSFIEGFVQGYEQNTPMIAQSAPEDVVAKIEEVSARVAEFKDNQVALDAIAQLKLMYEQEFGA